MMPKAMRGKPGLSVPIGNRRARSTIQRRCCRRSHRPLWPRGATPPRRNLLRRQAAARRGVKASLIYLILLETARQNVRDAISFELYAVSAFMFP